MSGGLMKTLFPSAWQWLEERLVLEADTPGDKRRKISLFLIALFCTLTGVLFALRSFLIDGLVAASWLPATYATIVGTSLVIYLVTKRIGHLLYPFLIMILIIPVVFHASQGGFASRSSFTILFWAILAPIGALMFLTIRHAIYWFVVYSGFALVAYILDSRFIQYLPTDNYVHVALDNFLGMIAMSITIFMTTLYFVHAFQREQKKSNQLVVELKQTNRELESTLTELQETQAELVQSEKVAALGKLAAGLAHEINTPIGALRSSASTTAQCLEKLEEVIEENSDPDAGARDAKFRKYIRILKDSSNVFTTVGNRISDVLKGFISFARLDSAQFDVVDIHVGLDDALLLLQSELKPDTIIKKEYGDIPKISCYPAELNQVFLHLLTNAAQAVRENGLITIRTFAEPDHFHIEIRDNGIGIASDRLVNLFNPEFSQKGQRVKSGLGLFISYRIIQQHQGEIKVSSKQGEGSTFTVILPLHICGG
jgi:signal transduction histidine kinase